MAMKSEGEEPVTERSKETPTPVKKFDPFGIYKVPKPKPRVNLTTGLLAASIKDWDNIVRYKDVERNTPKKQASDLLYEVPSCLEPSSLNLTTALPRVENYFKTLAAREESSRQTTLSSGHRVIIGNLSASVTKPVVQELFSDIGELIHVRMAQTAGIAEVIYKSLKDAQNAVKTYHNRHLNGQPMKCLLIDSKGGAHNKLIASIISSSNLQLSNNAPRNTAKGSSLRQN